MPQQLSGEVKYSEEAGVGIWTIADLGAALESGELEDGEEHFKERAGQDDMNGAVVVIENTDNVGSEMLEHVNEQWTELGEATGINRTAYVADGVTKLAIANKNEAEGMEAKGFNQVDDAVDWAAEV